MKVILYLLSSIVLSACTDSQSPTIPEQQIYGNQEKPEDEGDSRPEPQMNTPVNIVPLYSETTQKEPTKNSVVNGIAYSYIGERVRERHAREDQFKRYRNFPRFYFENRVFELEVIDKSTTNTPEVVFNVVMDHPTDGDLPFTGRFFFSGVNTVADYFIGVNFETVTNEYNDGRYHYRYTLRNERVVPGRLMEMELTFFLNRTEGIGSGRGDANYYSRTWLLELGKPGFLPWDEIGGLPTNTSVAQDSLPLPNRALTGGNTTLSADTSDELQRSLQQMGQNLAPQNAQKFVEGRRIFHTDFISGSHSEIGNGVFESMKYKAGPLYNQASCIGCHTNNGRSLPPNSNEAITNMVFKIAQNSDQGSASHPQFGSSFQVQGVGREGEGFVQIVNYQTFRGQYADGSGFELVKPIFEYSESIDQHHELVAPPLVGMGLIEAIDEKTIREFEDPEDSNQDGISGRIAIVNDLATGELRLGRFGWKADRANLRQQIAGALADDMGVSTSFFPLGGVSPEVTNEDLEKLRLYLATLGTPPHRNYDDDVVRKGKVVFTRAQCASCHISEMITGSNHPLAELRNQVIRPYSDFLLHDMGQELSGSVTGKSASKSEWRTPPLWGIGLTKVLGNGQESYLHDGRARNLEEAILWHGGEAQKSKEIFMNLSQSDRTALITFLKSL